MTRGTSPKLVALAATALVTALAFPTPARAQLGLFIHYGPLSLVGDQPKSRSVNLVATERSPSYPAQFASRFHPSQTDANRMAESWARLARNAGARYMIFTAKHVDGYALWPGYDYGSTTDVVAAVARAAHRHHLKLILYFSLQDAYHQRILAWDAYREFVRRQLLDLLFRYRPAGFWFDAAQAVPSWLADGNVSRLIAELQANSPNRLRISNNMCCFNGGWVPGVTELTYERGLPGAEHSPTGLPTEIVDTVGRYWSYFRDDRPRTVRQLRAMVAVARAFHADIALGVGPKVDGTIAPAFARALRASALTEHDESATDRRSSVQPPVEKLRAPRQNNRDHHPEGVTR